VLGADYGGRIQLIDGSEFVVLLGTNGFCWVCLAGSVLVAAGGSALLGTDLR
jgi:hypothetical protein